jgi:hypothetical protein
LNATASAAASNPPTASNAWRRRHARRGYGRHAPRNHRTHYITGRIASDSAQRMIRDTAHAQHHPRMLNQPVRVQQLDPDSANRLIRKALIRHPPRPGRLTNNHIIIHK